MAADAQRRVGLLGGTFNPIHLAHLRAAEEVRVGEGLDRVDFVISADPPHKSSEEIASPEHRRAMVELAIADHPSFRVNAMELGRPGPSFSVDTIRACRDQEPDAAFTFILGADAYAEITTWKDFATIFELCNVCVISRPGSPPDTAPIAVEKAFCYDSLRGRYTHPSGFTLVFQPMTDLMISATDIRHACAQGGSIRYLVPESVRSYIDTHALYRQGTPTS